MEGTNFVGHRSSNQYSSCRWKGRQQFAFAASPHGKKARPEDWQAALGAQGDPVPRCIEGGAVGYGRLKPTMFATVQIVRRSVLGVG